MRSLLGAGFPLFAISSNRPPKRRFLTLAFDRLGLKWGELLLGFFAFAMSPIPFIFYKFGSKLRKMSKIAPTEEEPYKLE